MDKELEKLRNDDVVWFIFIGLSILRLFADNLQRRCLVDDDQDCGELAKKIFLFVLVVILIIYIYFFNNNCDDYMNSYGKEKDLNGIRLLGTFFLLLGTLFLICFNISNKDDILEDSAL